MGMQSLKSIFRKIILKWLRLTDAPVVKVYDGYGDAQRLIVYGHVLRLSPLPPTRYTSNVLTNMFALIRLFVVRPYRYATVRMQWNDQSYETQAEANGFFHF